MCRVTGRQNGASHQGPWRPAEEGAIQRQEEVAVRNLPAVQLQDLQEPGGQQVQVGMGEVPKTCVQQVPAQQQAVHEGPPATGSRVELYSYRCIMICT